MGFPSLSHLPRHRWYREADTGFMCQRRSSLTECTLRWRACELGREIVEDKAPLSVLTPPSHMAGRLWAEESRANPHW